MKKILVFNVGSSSCKIKIFNSDLSFYGQGLIERIGTERADIKFNWLPDRKIIVNNKILFQDLSSFLFKFISENRILNFNDVELLVHRVVNGGDVYKQDVVINTKKDLNKIKQIEFLAPLHNPYNIANLENFFFFCPLAKHVVVFDTTFHSQIPQENFIYPIPWVFYEKYKIKKYGAHGSSHGYVTAMMQKYFNNQKINLINLHLGNGSSACLVKNGISFNNSMGFTPLSGLIMGTRSGDVDPSIIFHLINNLNFDPKEVEVIFNKKSGLLGISRISSDMRDIIKEIKNGNKNALLARQIFIQKIVDTLSVYLNQTNKKEAIVFTGGIGENDFELIKTVCQKISFLNLKLKSNFSNNNKINLISESDSEVPIFIIPAEEEWYMAQKGIKLIKNQIKIENKNNE